ncbi:hypothetical protein BDQ12DRAFT_214347 [Crucibulum laeve]|uniref:Protein kinase domain-containing protein n=1 Tax=Crucibulum laeve TaxID=68775 RepID=A0A5C3LW65_9AGAR|nr:hypothetical protein BDQ12DRAFT_214347 [Crucibulum laeve]
MPVSTPPQTPPKPPPHTAGASRTSPSNSKSPSSSASVAAELPPTPNMPRVSSPLNPAVSVSPPSASSAFTAPVPSSGSSSTSPFPSSSAAGSPHSTPLPLSSSSASSDSPPSPVHASLPPLSARPRGISASSLGGTRPPVSPLARVASSSSGHSGVSSTSSSMTVQQAMAVVGGVQHRSTLSLPSGDTQHPLPALPLDLDDFSSHVPPSSSSFSTTTGRARSRSPARGRSLGHGGRSTHSSPGHPTSPLPPASGTATPPSAMGVPPPRSALFSSTLPTTRGNQAEGGESEESEEEQQAISWWCSTSERVMRPWREPSAERTRTRKASSGASTRAKTDKKEAVKGKGRKRAGSDAPSTSSAKYIGRKRASSSASRSQAPSSHPASPQTSPHPTPQQAPPQELDEDDAGEQDQDWDERAPELMLARRTTGTPAFLVGRALARKKTIPEEQEEGWVATRTRVAQAARSVLGTGLDVTHELLAMSIDYLDFVPIPGLSAAAKTLLGIWDALQGVDMNRLACLRLTERCAEILISVRQEVNEAGDQVTEELKVPLGRLEDSFLKVKYFLLKQANRPFIKRYLKRDEILKEIAGLDSALRNALGMFDMSVHLRILRTVQENERQRQIDHQRMMAAFLAGQGRRLALTEETFAAPDGRQTQGRQLLSIRDVAEDEGVNADELVLTGLGRPTTSGGEASMLLGTNQNGNISSSTLVPAPGASSLPANGSATTPVTIPISLPIPVPQPRTSLPLVTSPISQTSPSQLTKKQIITALASLQSKQNEIDAQLDLADMRGLMREALQSSSDVKIVEMLQIQREEMAEAIKTLQRELEKEVEREQGDGIEITVGGGDSGGSSGALAMPVPKTQPGAGEPLPPSSTSTGGEPSPIGKMVRRISLQRGDSAASSNGGLKRSKTVASTQSSDSGTASGTGSGGSRKDTLDREFLESGIDALRRMSRGTGVDTNLPSWTITRYEVDRDRKIGLGFFSTVYYGRWRGRTVAIKVLDNHANRSLFVREVGIWKTLRHPNVLELYGASSTAGDPPWFFVSPYERNGSLVEFLRKLDMDGTAKAYGLGFSAPAMTASVGRGRMATFPGFANGSLGSSRGVSPSRDVPRELDLWRFMHEIAKGMEYLHSKGVLHGDLKGANVLVDDRIHCVISDFGQSELKSEVYRISGHTEKQGTLRWQAPELMLARSHLTPAMDVYSYAITCAEILGMGLVPWQGSDDNAIRILVLQEHSRPPLPPNSRFNTPALQDLLRICWHDDPKVRPGFERIAREMKQIRKTPGQLEDISTPKLGELRELDEPVEKPSPDLRPITLPLVGSPPRDILFSSGSPNSASTFHTAHSQSASSTHSDTQTSHEEKSVRSGSIRMPIPVLFTPSRKGSVASSMFLPSESSEGDNPVTIPPYDGYDSPPPMDEHIAGIRDEKRYRMLLEHGFHPSLTLPLWTPSPVVPGAVGYLSRPAGSFVTLFNAFCPTKAEDPTIRSMPNVYGYGKVQEGSLRVDRRTFAQRGVDAIAGLLTFRSKGDGQMSISRRYSFPLRAGHRVAIMCTETTNYRYLDSLDAPKKWFRANVDSILKVYGDQHQILKEELFMVIGALQTPNYALFVGHNHPDGHVHFNVYSSSKVGQPWGMFTTDTEAIKQLGGPSYNEPVDTHRLSASKVSDNGGDKWDSVLLARLRFKPDVLEPTSQ